MAPSDGLVSGGYCLASPGKEYVIFQAAARPFSLRLDGATGPVRARWFRPFTGEYREADPPTGGAPQWTPPPTWEAGPVVLRATAGSTY